MNLRASHPSSLDATRRIRVRSLQPQWNRSAQDRPIAVGALSLRGVDSNGRWARLGFRCARRSLDHCPRNGLDPLFRPGHRPVGPEPHSDALRACGSARHYSGRRAGDGSAVCVRRWFGWSGHNYRPRPSQPGRGSRTSLCRALSQWLNGTAG